MSKREFAEDAGGERRMRARATTAGAEAHARGLPLLGVIQAAILPKLGVPTMAD